MAEIRGGPAASRSGGAAEVLDTMGQEDSINERTSQSAPGVGGTGGAQFIRNHRRNFGGGHRRKSIRRVSRESHGSLTKFGRWWWALPGVLLVFAVHYLATGFGGFYAFTDWSGIGDFEWIGFQNFTDIFSDWSMIRALGNTLFLAFGSVLVANIAGLVLALGLNRSLKTRYGLRVLFFMPVVLSPLATAYVWRYIFEYDGPVNAVLKAVGMEDLARAWVADPTFAIWVLLLVIAWQTTGIPMVIFMAGLAGVPQEIEEAAAIDGASVVKRLWYVVLPSLRPAIAISTILGIVNGLRVFDPIMAITGGGPAGVTENLATVVYKESFALGNFGYGAALALVLTVIIIIFAVIQQRLTQGPKD